VLVSEIDCPNPRTCPDIKDSLVYSVSGASSWTNMQVYMYIIAYWSKIQFSIQGQIEDVMACAVLA
jgi:hypothetical protein